jgi:alpha-1,6-mannosyltransferase
MTRSAKWLLPLLGFLSIAIYVSALELGDLREHTIEFEWLFFSAFALYGVACFISLQSEEFDWRVLFGIFAMAALMQGVLIFSRPTLSDDMYRYVWDGRVQAHGVSPYRYPPNAPDLAYLQDTNIYPSINRKEVVTVYPPAAEVAFALLWRIWPDNVHWFQAAMAAGGLLAGVLLVGLLRDLGLSPARALIFLWSPLLIFETAHSAHVDGLILPLLVGAWWAQVRGRDGSVGFLLGVATAMKFYPALLLPILWRPRSPQGRWRMPLAFAATVSSFYLPYAQTIGWQVFGYLPHYFQEKFNISPFVSATNNILNWLGLYSPNRLMFLAFGCLVIIGCWAIINPVPDTETVLRRCLWIIGIVTLFSQDLFSWYMLWLLPLVAIFLEPSDKRLGKLVLPRVDAWTGWWLFCGLVGLSYTFFIKWNPVSVAIQFQFFPLYAFLLISLVTLLWKKFASPINSTSIRQQSN